MGVCVVGGGGGRASDWASGWGPQHLHFTVTVLCDGVPPAAACARHWAVSEGVPGAPPSERAMRTFVPFHCEGALYGGRAPRGGGEGGVTRLSAAGPPLSCGRPRGSLFVTDRHRWSCTPPPPLAQAR